MEPVDSHNVKSACKKLIFAEEMHSNEKDNYIELILTEISTIVEDLKGFENCDESDIQE